MLVNGASGPAATGPSSEAWSYVPHDAALEEAVCGVLMRDPGARSSFLTASANAVDAFFTPHARALARLCLESEGRMSPAMAATKAPTILWPTNWLENTYDGWQIENTRGFPLLVSRLIDLHRQRQAQEAVSVLRERLNAGPMADVGSALIAHVEDMQSICRAGTAVADPSIGARLEVIERRIEAGQVRSLVPFGIRALDAVTEGVDFGNADSLIIGGPAKAGKTRLALNMVGGWLGAMAGEVRVSWISSESGFTPEKLVALLVAQAANRQLLRSGWQLTRVCAKDGAILDGSYRDDDTVEPIVRHVIGQAAKWPLWIHGAALSDGGTRVLGNALAAATADVDMRGANVVVVDNFQEFTEPSLFAHGEGGGRYDMMVRAVGSFMDLVSSRGVVLIGISQLNSQDRLAYGSSMEYEANRVFNVGRKGKGIGENEFDVRGVLVRNGPTFAVRLTWEPATGLIVGGKVLEDHD